MEERVAETPMQIPTLASPPANQCDSGGRDHMPDMRTAETPAFCRYGEAIEWQLLLEWGVRMCRVSTQITGKPASARTL